MVDTKEFINQMQREGTTNSMLADELGLNVSILHKKIHNEGGEVFTVKEANCIAALLSIPREMLPGIFFSKRVADTQSK